MQKLLLLLALSTCTQPSPPEHPSSNSTTTPEKTTAPKSYAAETPPSTPAPRWDFGPLAKEVPSGKTVKLHSRLQFKDKPGQAQVAFESCLPKAGCPELSLRYEVENQGSTPVTLWHAGFWPNHRVLLLNEDGTEAPLTKYGDEMKKTFTPRGPRDKNAPWPIAPGATDESDGPINLSALTAIFVAPSRPGKYALRVDYEEDLAFSSNTLTLFILPRGALGILQKLNQWDKDECDVIERPAAHPDRVAAGESNGFVGTQKEALQKLGVTVQWDAALQTYQVATARVP